MPHRLTLAQMIAKIRARQLSPVELVEAHLRQIETHNPKVNAFIAVLGEEALAAAKRADGAGPLHGIPVTIKDSFDMVGLPTTRGSRLFMQHRAARDATSVARLRAAGAIPIGKTNCPEFLSSYESDNNVIGRSNNPWDLDRTPGGSSGGEAAAISSFCSAGGIGSDGGGSIRVPAHFCGIAGLKPTPGRVSGVGHQPEMHHPSGLLGVAGPMARTAEDVRILFEVLTGYDPADPFSVPVPLRKPDPTGLRVGCMPRFYKVPVQAAVARAIETAAACLRDIGIPVEPFEPKCVERSPNLWSFFFSELPARSVQDFITGREDQVHWTGTEFLKLALQRPESTAAKVVENLGVRDKMRAGLLREMEKFPVILAAVCSISAFRHRQRRYSTPEKEIGQFEAMMPATLFNLLGMPALTIPFGRDEDGMPVGIQIVGRPWDEELLLELAVRMEETRGPFGGPPGY